jgi:hypothetical protein
MKAFAVSVAGAMLLSASAFAQAPSASTVGSGAASGGSGTIGTAGSAAAGGTSASTLGTGGTSTGPSGTSSSIGGAGSAAAVGGKVSSSNKLHQNSQMMQDQAKAKAQNGGTWSKSMTKTKLKHGELTSRTKSMSHEPGGAPAKSTTRENVSVR